MTGCISTTAYIKGFCLTEGIALFLPPVCVTAVTTLIALVHECSRM